MNKGFRKLGITAVPAALAGAVILAMAAPASASPRDGYLEQHEFGMYWEAGRSGCVFDINNDDPNFTDNYFAGPAGCGGRGQNTNDNTESYWNRDAFGWNVYTDVNWKGIKGSIPIGHIGDASSNFRNKISSSDFYVQ
ncbi:peptidase inhibitor family I36 protein [Streptomyces sp. MS1.HAVA.3]|uniref:Peptidase inhibitor family I36 protein n=1 Tax=Streptomyces caledonius TaxID=3134107 RepID=A0ABU8U507_9ACTN